MRWFPVPLGENVKEAVAWGKADYMSSRYPWSERATRLLRREWDLLKTRRVQQTDLERLIRANTVDLGLGPPPGNWPQSRVRTSRSGHLVEFARELKQVLNSR